MEKHWFVSWLVDQANHEFSWADKCCREAQEDSPPLCAVQHEEAANQFLKWAGLADDMISCGLVELSLIYYDAKQAIESQQIPLHSEKIVLQVLERMSAYLEKKLEETTSLESLQQLKMMETTISELFSVGMDEAALTYYQRAIRKYPELNLLCPMKINF